MSGAEVDPVVATKRALISETDERIVDAVNRRVLLVAELHAHKRRSGLPIRDLERERRLLDRLDEINQGPLSSESLHRLYTLLLDLCTAEAARLAADTPGQ